MRWNRTDPQGTEAESTDALSLFVVIVRYDVESVRGKGVRLSFAHGLCYLHSCFELMIDLMDCIIWTSAVDLKLGV